MLWIGLLLLGLGFAGATLTLAKITKEVLSPIPPTEKTKRLLAALKVQFGKNYTYVQQILPYVQAASRKYNVPPELILAFMAQESRGNPRAVSSVGAVGLMQVMPRIAKRLCGYSQEDLFDPVKNIDCGTRLIAYLMRRVETITDVIASYYAGEKAYRYRKKYGTYPSYGRPPVYQYVSEVYERYKFLKGAA